jgi:hypothetical protein
MATFGGDDYKFPDEADSKQKAEPPEKLEIEIEDDTPPKDRNRKPSKEPVADPTEAELASYDDKVQSRIKKFTRGYHDERRAKEAALREREAAETYARQVLEENKRLQQQLANGSQRYIETSKTAAEGRLNSAKDKLKTAFEAGDSEALANAQAEVADATAQLRETVRMRPVEVDESKFAPPPSAQSANAVTPRTQKWMSKNSEWFGRDDEMTMTAMGIDKKLQREYGADYVGTKEYFKTIDKTMRKRFPEYFGSKAQSYEDDEPPQQKRAEPANEEEPPRRASKPATVVAPASRSTPPSRVRLKASEAAIARRLGVPLELYAKQVADLKRGE